MLGEKKSLYDKAREEMRLSERIPAVGCMRAFLPLYGT